MEEEREGKEGLSLTHHSGEDESHALDSCLGFVLPSFGTVVEREQTLTDWIGIGHCGVVQEGDMTNTPTLDRGKREASKPQKIHLTVSHFLRKKLSYFAQDTCRL